MASRLTFALSRSRAPALTAFKRSYAIAAKPLRVTPTAKPTAALKANTYATKANTDELDAFAELSRRDTPPESVPSSRVLQGSENNGGVIATEDVAGTEASLTAALDASNDGTTDWSRSYQGLGAQPFPKEATELLLSPIDPMDIEMKPGELPLARLQHRA